MKEKQFDDFARQALSDYRVPFEEQDWMAFEAQMTAQKTKPVGFWFWKGLEFAIIIAVLGTVVYDLKPSKGESLPINTSTTGTAYSVSNPNTNTTHDNTVSTPSAGINRESAHLTNSNSHEASMPHALVSSKKGLNDKINRNLAQPQVTNGKSRKSVSLKETLLPSKLGPEPPNKTNTPQSNVTASRSNELEQLIVTDKSKNAVANVLTKSGWNVSHSYDATARSEFGELAYLNAVHAPKIDDNDNNKLKKKPIVSPKSKKHKTKNLPWCLGASFSPDLNLMMPSPNPSMGLSLNVNITQYMTSRLAIESGISYTLKHYLNDPISTISHPVDNSYDRIVENKLVTSSNIEVPVHLRYDIKSTRSLKVYVLSGATIGMTVSNLYDNEQKYYLNTSLVNTVLNRRVGGSRGLFQGGLFGDNDIMTGDLAFGFEHSVGRNSSLFVQPGARFSLNPLGDNRKYLASFSLGFGMRWKF